MQKGILFRMAKKIFLLRAKVASIINVVCPLFSCENILGSGLGLSIVQRIAELYHIEIQVENMEKGLCVTTHLTCIEF